MIKDNTYTNHFAKALLLKNTIITSCTSNLQDNHFKGQILGPSISRSLNLDQDRFRIYFFVQTVAVQSLLFRSQKKHLKVSIKTKRILRQRTGQSQLKCLFCRLSIVFQEMSPGHFKRYWRCNFTLRTHNMNKLIQKVPREIRGGAWRNWIGKFLSFTRILPRFRFSIDELVPHILGSEK